MNKQAGGTLAGFLIGLLVGLGAALAVAVYVTKVPIPLVDRGLGRKAAQDAEEQERNKDWNPNAGLAGKNVPVAKPAEEAPAAAPAPAPAPVSAPTPATTAVPAVTPSEPVAAKPAAPAKPAGKEAPKDPLGELIQSHADSGAAKAEPEADPFIYFIQAGAFRSPEEAETQRARLAMLGFDAKVSEREQAGRLVYRVRLGPFRQKGEADRAQERLAVQGVEGALVRAQR